MFIQVFGVFHFFLHQRSVVTRVVRIKIHSIDPLDFSCFSKVLFDKTRTKATIALVLQSISIFVLLVSIGFLIAFISTTFTMCLGTQCSQTSNSFVSQSNTSPYRFSTETYYQLKRIFIGFQLALSLLFIICSIIYIILFIRCSNEVPHIYPIQDVETIDKLSTGQRLTSIPSSVRSGRSSTIVYTTTTSYYRAQKVCPNCKHVSEYVPDKDIVECPKCKYQSPLVEHAQQC